MSDREILFRGKPKEDYYFFSQNWKDHCKDGVVYGSLITVEDKRYICVSAQVSLKCCINNSIASMIEVYPETVGRFTGLTDKNGVKIFEGDILKGYWDTKLVVFYDEISTSYKVRDFSGAEKEISYYTTFAKIENLICCKAIEVIGNIHDNPELMRGE